MPQPTDIIENAILRDDSMLLDTLLQDHATGQHIFWATDSYAGLEAGFRWGDAMTAEAITGHHEGIIRPRALKSRDEQQRRSRQMAEVFTPSWVVSRMCDVFDEEWLPKDGQTWHDYVLATCLEITCGEAPFLASRYDAVTGEPIALDRRVGLLDRKLRMVGAHCTEADWKRWALLALGSVYGYEWQGDNLLLAREALLATFAEYHERQFGTPPDKALLRRAADIVSWNVWQMDGLKAVVPGSCREVKTISASLFGNTEVTVDSCPGCARDDVLLHNGIRCRLRRWLPSETAEPDYFDCLYTDFIVHKTKTHHKTKWPMKFDFVIGNPPYQEEKEDNGRQPPIYDKFMDGTYKVSNKVMLISPARFLFNAGQTSKDWNKKMLNDPHLKVLYYEQDSSKVFPGTDIKGGVSVTYHNNDINYGAIGVFTSYDKLNSILHKVKGNMDKSLADIIFAPTKFDLDHLYEKHPDYKSLIKSDGKDKLLRTNIFERLEIFHEVKESDDDIAVIGVISNKRHWRFLNRYYVDDNNGQVTKWKVLLTESNGAGTLGEILSSPLISGPQTGYTQTFIGIGAFSTEGEAKAAFKYVTGKFARTMLAVLKITQHNPIGVWKYVPLQDFTPSSDIDWTKSIHDIDLQLYDKYGLTDDERQFIETHVKAME